MTETASTELYAMRQRHREEYERAFAGLASKGERDCFRLAYSDKPRKPANWAEHIATVAGHDLSIKHDYEHLDALKKLGAEGYKRARLASKIIRKKQGRK